ncbi:MAG: hypothetical protein ACK54P_01590, partial [Bacteroidota bacterium]
MWAVISAFILRNRFTLGILMLVATALMGWQATKVRMSYKFSGLLPDDDSVALVYQNFIDQFSEDGHVMVIGLDDPDLWELQNFRKWKNLGDDLRRVTVPVDTVIGGRKQVIQRHAVDSVFSVAHC